MGGLLILLAAGFGALTWRGWQRRRERSLAASTKSIRPFVTLDVESGQASAKGDSAHSSSRTAQLQPIVLELNVRGQPIVLGRGSCGKVSHQFESRTSDMRGSETCVRRVHWGDAVRLRSVVSAPGCKLAACCSMQAKLLEGVLLAS